ncbi:hypothetical protein T492DRAFT_1088254 [Pavlovales sp. CCMP2436]|nr:hypothetical protein T492DRAFT_1088254 [Pavlovales sp. CCMP2436]|mmetsp:Transcript_14333/g.36398  ORF Transcript_14333/g.36398 Transcript_14333/m.36398 type:complete len:246 (+) Transcript_14333:40-777(+)
MPRLRRFLRRRRAHRQQGPIAHSRHVHSRASLDESLVLGHLKLALRHRLASRVHLDRALVDRDHRVQPVVRVGLRRVIRRRIVDSLPSEPAQKIFVQLNLFTQVRAGEKAEREPFKEEDRVNDGARTLLVHRELVLMTQASHEPLERNAVHARGDGRSQREFTAEVSAVGPGQGFVPRTAHVQKEGALFGTPRVSITQIRQEGGVQPSEDVKPHERSGDLTARALQGPRLDVVERPRGGVSREQR